MSKKYIWVWVSHLQGMLIQHDESRALRLHSADAEAMNLGILTTFTSTSFRFLWR